MTYSNGTKRDHEQGWESGYGDTAGQPPRTAQRATGQHQAVPPQYSTGQHQAVPPQYSTGQHQAVPPQYSTGQHQAVPPQYSTGQHQAVPPQYSTGQHQAVPPQYSTGQHQAVPPQYSTGQHQALPQQPTTLDQLPRLTDGRWTPMPVVAEAPTRAAGHQQFTSPAPRNEATTQLAVTNNRVPQYVAEPEIVREPDPSIDDAWSSENEFDMAFEEASTRFFDTDPGNRLTYAHLLEVDDEPAPQVDPTPSYQVPVVDKGVVHRDDSPLDDDDLASVAAARRNAIEWAVVLVAAVLLALVLRAVVLQAFFIPSPSMEDTLLIQDRVLVNKLSYQFSDVTRGDIVVFHRTDDEIAAAGPNQPRDVIKRVIGLGGESIEIRNNAVHINGQLLVEPYLDPGLVMADFGPVAVPEGTVFVMGDNRNLSSDSRGELGPIEEERIVGRAFVLFWPLNRLGRL